MITTPMDVLKQHPIRKTKKQKALFRDEVTAFFEKEGYTVSIEKGPSKSHNIVVGDSSKARYVVSAHYDTPAVMPFPNLITPRNFWLFIAWQILVSALVLLPFFLADYLFSWLFAGAEYASLLVYYSDLAVLFATFELMIKGPANKNNANDNTSGVVSVLEIAQRMPANKTEQVCFVLFDLEEAGLIGSRFFYRKHKQDMKEKLLLNLDCVGDGDDILVFPEKKVKKNEEMMQWLSGVETEDPKSEKKITVCSGKGFSYNPSDQKSFPYGIGFITFRRNKRGILYLDKIHTRKDTVLEEENIELICSKILNLISV